jgi:hypothetical protein
MIVLLNYSRHNTNVIHFKSWTLYKKNFFAIVFSSEATLFFLYKCYALRNTSIDAIMCVMGIFSSFYAMGVQ